MRSAEYRVFTPLLARIPPTSVPAAVEHPIGREAQDVDDVTMRSRTAAALILLGATSLRAGIGFGEAFCGADALFSGLTNAPPVPQALALVIQGTENLERWTLTHQLDVAHNEDPLFALGLLGLRTHTNAPISEFVEHLGALHMLADTKAPVDAGMARVSAALQRLLDAFPESDAAEALRTAERRSCQFHVDQVGRKGDACFKCGSRLVRPVPVVRQLGLASPQSVVASFKGRPRLTNGISQTHTLHLSMINQAPVTSGRLIRVHGEKVHLFLLDETFCDYHHVHPRPSSKPGEYQFAFAPEKPGSYRVWVELHAAPFAFRQYATLELPGNESCEPRVLPREQTSFQHGDLRFELLTDALHVGVASRMRLRVTRNDGTPFEQLEPLMEAFAHLVGFGENHRTILHTHPRMPAVTDPRARGGPELEFQVLPTEPGHTYFFAQVRIQGKVSMIPFGLKVAAGNSEGRLTRR